MAVRDGMTTEIPKTIPNKQEAIYSKNTLWGADKKETKEIMISPKYRHKVFQVPSRSLSRPAKNLPKILPTITQDVMTAPAVAENPIEAA